MDPGEEQSHTISFSAPESEGARISKSVTSNPRLHLSEKHHTYGTHFQRGKPSAERSQLGILPAHRNDLKFHQVSFPLSIDQHKEEDSSQFQSLSGVEHEIMFPDTEEQQNQAACCSPIHRISSILPSCSPSIPFCSLTDFNIIAVCFTEPFFHVIYQERSTRHKRFGCKITNF